MLSLSERRASIAAAHLQVLMEEQQVLPSGIARNRGLPLAEKLLPREEWKDCLVRALHEELGSILEPNKLSYCCNASEYR